MNKKLLIAFVGMPGAGKSEASKYVEKKGIAFVRFGDVTDEGLKEKGLEQTPENEREFRENLRKELGMAAYAIKSKPRIDQVLIEKDAVVLDGLYSWEEYIYLKKEFPGLILIHIFASSVLRYTRLSTRAIRPFSEGEARKRDIDEITKLNKAGPIAIADYSINHDEDNFEHFHQQIDSVLQKIGVTV